MFRALGLGFILAVALTACVSASHTAQVKRAEAGNYLAQFELGKRYALGDGVKQDNAVAELWFAKAAATNSIIFSGISRFYLRQMDDPLRAIDWMRKNLDDLKAGIARRSRDRISFHCLVFDERVSPTVGRFAKSLVSAALGDVRARGVAHRMYLRATERDRGTAKTLARRCMRTWRQFTSYLVPFAPGQL